MKFLYHQTHITFSRDVRFPDLFVCDVLSQLYMKAYCKLTKFLYHQRQIKFSRDVRSPDMCVCDF